ncbi:MAG: RdgB/HAM1 family non-canonical purine NTP pyrophosphatase [Spirochaetaceae bacterium]|jgi:XTP/dITP diphosphohydrolase|nr:RdgB/HAM1 family non-canonical purine NTP pyrophosphatase [Spirochaetaceae bacterium]
MKTIWFATANEHKRKELSAILNAAGQRCTVKIPSDEGLQFDPLENGADFFENAMIKAKALHHLTGDPVIADDSGLCVKALGGRPGIFSARYGCENGKKLNDRDRNALLLKEIGNNPVRDAYFICSMVLMFEEERFFSAQELLNGEIIDTTPSGSDITSAPRGSGGFGYDPIFFLPEMNCTLAELDADEKNKISHRGKAGRALACFLKDIHAQP